MSDEADTAGPEWSFEINVSSLPRDGRRVALQADETIRAAIAARFGVEAVNALSGEATIASRDAVIAVEGAVKAAVLRTCVASLETFTEDIDEPFQIEFSRERAPEPAEEEMEIEGPEPLEGDVLDIAEIFVQQVSLAMAAFPRKPGAESLAQAFGGGDPASPFADLREKLEKSETKA